MMTAAMPVELSRSLRSFQQTAAWRSLSDDDAAELRRLLPTLQRIDDLPRRLARVVRAGRRELRERGL